MGFIYDLIGRFHPLFVHLPIGFIIIGLMLDIFFRNKKEHAPVLRFVFLWAFITSIFSIITGYLQYDKKLNLLCLFLVRILFIFLTLAIISLKFLFHANLHFEYRPNDDTEMVFSNGWSNFGGMFFNALGPRRYT